MEEKDADERRADLMNLIGGDEDDEESSSDDDEAHDNNVPTVDEGEMTKEEKIKLVKRQSPELFPLIAELKLYKGEMDDLLVPLTNIFTEEGQFHFELLFLFNFQTTRNSSHLSSIGWTCAAPTASISPSISG